MGLADLDWIAVFVASVAGFLLGGLWYSPLVWAKAWVPLAHPGKSMEELQRQGAGAAGYGLAFVATLVAAATLAFFVDALGGGAANGVRVGLYAAVGFVGTTFATNYFFAGKPAKLYGIDAGYQMLMMVVMGAVIGLWPW